jgi:uncharacterized membrane protein
MNRFKRLWSTLRSSFWFMPAWIVLGSVAVAVILIEADYHGGTQWLNQWPLLFGAGADGARGMMSTIAGSMMTVVGVTFSMILVVLTLASSQYTSRILRNFTRNRVTQAVLGIFAGIFTYCLIVLRTIRSGDEGAFVPSLAVFFGFVLALVGVGALMFFIQHIASSIEASGIIASIARETITAVDRLFPEKLGQEPDESEDYRAQCLLADRNWIAVPAKESGYIQSVNNAAILCLARDNKTIVRMEHGIGEFVVQGTKLASLALEDPPAEQTIADLQSAFSIKNNRTVEQDAAFGIRQIVDIALKALSPGINDTTTAVMSVDYLASVLARVAPRQIPSSHRFEDGELRVIAKGPSFESLLGESFDQIRRSANGDMVILSRMLDALQIVASLTACPSRQRVLREQVEWIAELAEHTIDSAHDRVAIDRHLSRVFETLETELDWCGGE